MLDMTIQSMLQYLYTDQYQLYLHNKHDIPFALLQVADPVGPPAVMTCATYAPHTRCTMTFHSLQISKVYCGESCAGANLCER